VSVKPGEPQTTDPDLLIQYTSAAGRYDRETREIPMLAILLQAVKDGHEDLDSLALGHHTVDAKFFPKASPAALLNAPQSTTSKGNAR
jgi:hypothetical protein